MQEYEIKLKIKIKNDLLEAAVVDLIYEQWDQTPAAEEGDTIQVLSCIKIR